MEKYLQKLEPLFIKIGEKIGEGGVFAWEVVMKQQYVNALVGLFWGIIGTFALILAWKWAKKIINREWEEVSWGFLAPWIIFWIWITGMNFQILLTHLLNPEYYAIEFFIGLVK